MQRYAADFRHAVIFFSPDFVTPLDVSIALRFRDAAAIFSCYFAAAMPLPRL